MSIHQERAKAKAGRTSLSNIIIKEVKTKAERRIFVDFPNRLYRDNDNFVPAFFGDDMADWDEKKNPAFEYCEARSWRWPHRRDPQPRL